MGIDHIVDRSDALCEIECRRIMNKRRVLDGSRVACKIWDMLVSWVLLAGILMVQTMPQILLAGIVLFAASTLFSFITLPVEINASQRALAWMSRAGITNAFNHQAAVDALKSAAYTYVVAALSSLATLVYYVMIYMGRRD